MYKCGCDVRIPDRQEEDQTFFRWQKARNIVPVIEWGWLHKYTQLKQQKFLQMQAAYVPGAAFAGYYYLRLSLGIQEAGTRYAR